MKFLVALDVPWRFVEDDFFSEQKKNGIKRFINGLEFPENCQNINLFVVGNVGSGKSSFVNTLATVFRDNTKLANPAAVYGIQLCSGTKKLHEITLKTFENGNKIRIYDCRGIERGQNSIFEKDLQCVIDGHVKKDYQFRQNESIDHENVYYRNNPTISDQMHCVLIVAKATDVHVTPNLKKIQNYLSGKDVPLRLILTSMDKLDLYELGEVRSVFRSRAAKIKVDQAKDELGVQDNQILPVANYVSGTHQDIYRDILALQAIENILEETLLFLRDKA